MTNTQIKDQCFVTTDKLADFFNKQITLTPKGINLCKYIRGGLEEKTKKKFELEFPIKIKDIGISLPNQEDEITQHELLLLASQWGMDFLRNINAPNSQNNQNGN